MGMRTRVTLDLVIAAVVVMSWTLNMRGGMLHRDETASCHAYPFPKGDCIAILCISLKHLVCYVLSDTMESDVAGSAWV